jgi:hypothetical protein
MCLGKPGTPGREGGLFRKVADHVKQSNYCSIINFYDAVQDEQKNIYIYIYKQLYI